MVLKYENVVPWGRSYREYAGMFMLSQDDHGKYILGCGDGPASFNSEMTEMGYRVRSVDPIYRFSGDEIQSRIDETCDIVLEKTRQNKDKFVWTTVRNIDELKETRMSAMAVFLRDYERGRKEGRYIAAELPALPFSDNEFDLALCSHLLFLYSANLNCDFHISAINEMLRVAGEVRIFPLLDSNAERSRYVDAVISYCRGKYPVVEEVTVNYEFQKGGNRMLRVCRRPDDVL